MVPIHPQTMAKILAAVWANKEIQKITNRALEIFAGANNPTGQTVDCVF